ncbi:N-(5'-phosphoribosyl)anthranilate isomerase, partial [Escherichia coli]|nr:N-(5'-phosphoribosyl)anthranilate isomerase [Escherichia coli]
DLDISSGVETNGEKDPQKIKCFIKTAKGVE